MILPHRFQGSGPPLVLLTGLGAKGTSWQPFLAHAAAQRRVLTIDPRGSGEAPALDGPVTLRELAADVLDVLDHVGLERAAVVGRSMGGMIAQELALLAPERVGALVLASTTGRVDAHLASVFRLWADLAEVGVPAELRHRSSLLWCLGGDALERPGPARAYLEAKIRTDRAGDYARQARACAEHDALHRLPGLQHPALVISGSDDRLTPPPHAEALAKALPRARLRLVPGAGHLVYLERPETFARQVLGFLSQEHRDEPPGDATCPVATTAS